MEKYYFIYGKKKFGWFLLNINKLNYDFENFFKFLIKFIYLKCYLKVKY